MGSLLSCAAWRECCEVCEVDQQPTAPTVPPSMIQTRPLNDPLEDSEVTCEVCTGAAVMDGWHAAVFGRPLAPRCVLCGVLQQAGHHGIVDGPIHPVRRHEGAPSRRLLLLRNLLGDDDEPIVVEPSGLPRALRLMPWGDLLELVDEAISEATPRVCTS